MKPSTAKIRPAAWATFPFFDHLTMAEVQDRRRLVAKANDVGLTTSELYRLRQLRARSWPKQEGWNA